MSLPSCDIIAQGHEMKLDLLIVIHGDQKKNLHGLMALPSHDDVTAIAANINAANFLTRAKVCAVMCQHHPVFKLTLKWVPPLVIWVKVCAAIPRLRGQMLLFLATIHVCAYAPT